MEQVNIWCHENRMVVNAKKTNCMIVTTHQRTRSINMDCVNILFDNNPLNIVKEQKILGLSIGNNLNWHDQINIVCNKISSLIGLLWRIHHTLDYKSKILFYNSFILPRIDYCLCIWGSCSAGNLEKIYKLQKRVARIILGVDLSVRSKFLFSKLKWMTVFERYFYLNCIVVYKAINNITPSYMNELFNMRNCTSYSLRANENNHIELNFPRIELYKKSPSYKCASDWNSLPNNVKSAQSLDSFKFLCRQYILNPSLTPAE